MSNHATQSERLLTLLRTKEWISLPEILDLRIANYRARVSDLRGRGYVILNRKEEAADGTIHSFYHLAGEPERAKPQPQTETRTGQRELFA